MRLPLVLRRVPLVRAVDEDVRARDQRHDARLDRAPLFVHRAHSEGVRDDESAEADVVPKERQGLRGHRRGNVRRAERGDDHMRRHDRRNPERRRAAERDEFDRFKPRPVVVDARQPEMRVDIDVPVSREVLGAREHALARERRQHRGDESRDLARVRTERTDPDDGVVRVRVDVRDGSVVPRDSEDPQFPRHDARLIRGEARIARRAERHVPGPDRHALRDARDDAALLVDRDERRNATGGDVLDVRHERRDLPGRRDVPGTRIEDHAAEMQLRQRGPERAGHRVSVEETDDRLSGLLFRRHA